jgi:hypothetical protein
LDAEGKWQKNKNLQKYRDESNARAQIKVLKYRTGRSTTLIWTLLKNFLDDLEKIDESS